MNEDFTLLGLGIGYIIICIVVTIVVILVCRELVAWYTKRNIQIANQKKIIQLLEEQNELLRHTINKNPNVEENKE